MSDQKKEPMGRIVLSESFLQDMDRIEQITEQNEVANAYFQLLGKPRPAGIKFEKVETDDPTYRSAMHAELIIRRKIFLAAYAEKMNLLVYAEKIIGVESKEIE